jgi:hypothetical protein
MTTSKNSVVLKDKANNYVIADAVKFSSPVTSLADGWYALRIADGKDVIGNAMSTDISFTFYLDTQAPTVRNAKAPTISYLQNQTIKVQAYDLGSGIANVTVQVYNSSYSKNYPMQLAYNDYMVIGTWKFAPIGTYYAIISNSSLSGGKSYNYKFFVSDVSGNVNDTVTGSFYVNGTKAKTAGNIAFLCRNNPVGNTCNTGIENKTIQWLRSQNWTVNVNRYDMWALSGLTASTSLIKNDLIVCSDSIACNPTSAVYSAHQTYKIGFVEIPSSPNANAGQNFGYTTSRYGLTEDGETDIFITTADSITAGYMGDFTIYNATNKGIGYINNGNLGSSAVNIAEIGNTYAGYEASLFKVENSTAHGRYAWVGWFYSYSPSIWTAQDLNIQGQGLLKKTLNWAQCGNAMGCAK